MSIPKVVISESNLEDIVGVPWPVIQSEWNQCAAQKDNILGSWTERRAGYDPETDKDVVAAVDEIILAIEAMKSSQLVCYTNDVSWNHGALVITDAEKSIFLVTVIDKPVG